MSDAEGSRLESELERARALLREERAAFQERVLALETEQAELTAEVRRLRRALRRARSRQDGVPLTEELPPGDGPSSDDPSSHGRVGRLLARLRARP
jgi:hypothetical protein